MQNIIEICKEFGLDIPADKQSEFSKKVSENYLTKAEHDKKIGRIETDRDTWKEKAETAENTLKGFEGKDFDTITKERDEWKKKAEEAEASAKKQIYDRDFADALRTELESIKFTSEAAKRDVMSQITATELKLRDGKILGLSDLIAQIRKSDASAFVDEQQEQLEQNKAKFTTPMNNQGGKVTTMTKDEIMAIKDRGERREAMMAHKELFGLQ